jgi:hypothetical protein
MKGIASSGTEHKQFIVIKVNCKLTDDNINDIVQKKSIKRERILSESNGFICLYLYRYDSLSWYQLNRVNYGEMEPEFFTGNFTDPETGELIPSEKGNFDLLKTLIQQGHGADRNGLVWRITF